MTAAAKKRLLDALTACQAIGSFVTGKSFATYESDLLLRSGIERQFEILGEALHLAASAEPALIERIPELRRIVGLRNRIIHGYDSVDDEILWDIVQSKVPALATLLGRMLRD